MKTYQTRSGPMLALETDSHVGRSLEIYGEYCPAEWRILQQIIKPGMNVIVVGSNIGAHSVNMANACVPGSFYAFEPQPRIFQILCANLALNNVTNAFAYPDACGAQEGHAFVPFIDYNETGNFGGVCLGDKGIRVRVRTIDDLDLGALGLLKVDAEGFETHVIRGADRTIHHCRPVIYMENDRVENQGELIVLLESLGYRQYWHTPTLFDPINYRKETVNIFPGIASLNMLCIPRETGDAVAGVNEIDPSNWESPLRLRVFTNTPSPV